MKISGCVLSGYVSIMMYIYRHDILLCGQYLEPLLLWYMTYIITVPLLIHIDIRFIWSVYLKSIIWISVLSILSVWGLVIVVGGYSCHSIKSSRFYFWATINLFVTILWLSSCIPPLSNLFSLHTSRRIASSVSLTVLCIWGICTYLASTIILLNMNEAKLCIKYKYILVWCTIDVILVPYVLVTDIVAVTEGAVFCFVRTLLLYVFVAWGIFLVYWEFE